MSAPTFQFADLAYTKLVAHSLKHPHQPVNGVLLGTNSDSRDGTVDVVDAVPLQHHWTNLSPMMEVGLGMATSYAGTRQLAVVGYYQASERVDDRTLSPVGERVASKIKETFSSPIAIVIDGSKLDDEKGAALVPYVFSASSFRSVEGKLRFSQAIPTRALQLVRHSNILDVFGDFDDYLEDTSVRFLTNNEVEKLLSPS
ncbi:hypothetical protein BC834DRAFT_829342 [Gloeopeniophorella convolvens]|nr:hypothetical protein BC834DRAFT_829342 [Gloeopeniophorella convolvens]